MLVIGWSANFDKLFAKHSNFSQIRSSVKQAWLVHPCTDPYQFPLLYVSREIFQSDSETLERGFEGFKIQKISRAAWSRPL